jgi:hypothetical protein
MARLGGKSVSWFMPVSLNCNATSGKVERRSELVEATHDAL